MEPRGCNRPQIAGKSTGPRNRQNKRNPLPPAATGCLRSSMVRRGRRFESVRGLCKIPGNRPFLVEAGLHELQRAVGTKPSWSFQVEKRRSNYADQPGFMRAAFLRGELPREPAAESSGAPLKCTCAADRRYSAASRESSSSTCRSPATTCRTISSSFWVGRLLCLDGTVMAMISVGSSTTPIQCGVQVLNSAASPGESTKSWSPSTSRSRPLST
jgi:hypothetical protein